MSEAAIPEFEQRVLVLAPTLAWTVDRQDREGLAPAQIVDNVITRMAPGAVVLQASDGDAGLRGGAMRCSGGRLRSRRTHPSSRWSPAVALSSRSRVSPLRTVVPGCRTPLTRISRPDTVNMTSRSSAPARPGSSSARAGARPGPARPARSWRSTAPWAGGGDQRGLGEDCGRSCPSCVRAIT
jgi:hypothetical protein